MLISDEKPAFIYFLVLHVMECVMHGGFIDFQLTWKYILGSWIVTYFTSHDRFKSVLLLFRRYIITYINLAVNNSILKKSIIALNVDFLVLFFSFPVRKIYTLNI